VGTHAPSRKTTNASEGFQARANGGTEKGWTRSPSSNTREAFPSSVFGFRVIDKTGFRIGGGCRARGVPASCRRGTLFDVQPLNAAGSSQRDELYLESEITFGNHSNYNGYKPTAEYFTPRIE
jgi:hypothetical protein